MTNWKDIYFPHDCNATEDPKCVLLISQLGMEGYGIFWALVEKLRAQKDLRLPLSLLPALAGKWGTSAAKVETVVTAFGLFGIDDDQFFFSDSLTSRMTMIIEKADRRRNSAIKAITTRWETHRMMAKNSPGNSSKNGQNDTNVIRSNYERNTDVIRSYNDQENSELESENSNSQNLHTPSNILYNNIKLLGGMGGRRKNITKPFLKPTQQEVEDYIREKGVDVDPALFYAHYEAVGWMVGRNHMKNWHMAVMTWVRRQREGRNLPVNMNPKKSQYDGCLE